MKILTTLILIIPFFQIRAQTVDIENLKSAYEQLDKNGSQNNQRKFFEAFPNSFESFEKTFGYKNEKAAPLYYGYDYYLAKFFSLDSIPEKEQMKKWINISIDGSWHADAVNYFQHNLTPKILKNTDLLLKLFKNKGENETESFFYFFFSGIHIQFKTIPKEFDNIKNRDKKLYSLIEKGHKRAVEDSGH